jgi:hypothetical protein
MWFGIILQLFMLGCMAVLVWYASEALRVFTRLDVSFDKLRAFLDAQDINRRADETQERAEVGPLRDMMRGWLPLTYSLLGRLLSATEGVRSLGDDLVAGDRSTIATASPLAVAAPPAPAAPPSDAALAPDLVEIARQMDAAQGDGRTSDYDGMTQVHARSAMLPESSAPPSMPETTPKPGVSPASRQRVIPSVEIDVMSRASGYHPPFSSASAPVQSSAPSQVAAGLGPRPSSSTAHAKGPASRAPHSPPVRLTESTRSATLIGTMPAPASAPPHDDRGDRSSWEPLKRGGMIAASLRPVAEPRFPGTQVSMQAVTTPGSASPSSGRRPALVEVKEKCRDCDGGFVHVGTGGIGKCHVCAGSGLVATAAQLYR